MGGGGTHIFFARFSPSSHGYYGLLEILVRNTFIFVHYDVGIHWISKKTELYEFKV